MACLQVESDRYQILGMIHEHKVELVADNFKIQIHTNSMSNCFEKLTNFVQPGNIFLAINTARMTICHVPCGSMYSFH